MKMHFCVACLADEDLQHHHIVTRAEGGGDEDSNLITLCHDCHLKLHGRQKNGAYSASQHLREGFARARARGVVLGRKPKLTPKQRTEALARRAAGETLMKIAESYGVSHSAISRLRP